MKILFALVVATALVLFSATPLLRATVPSGFTENEIADGLSSPSCLETAPDGRVFVAQQGGVIRVIKDDVMLDTPFTTLTVDGSVERGLLGITLDPSFSTNHYVYVYYTATSPAPHNRLSRLTANGDQMQSGSEVILLDLPNLPTSATIHMGGATHFGSDGKIYISVGDNHDNSNAQSLSNPFGKILRVNSDGTIPTNNPFFGQTTGINRAIWAYGVRNPFTTAFQPGTGRFFINDVGESSWEEINDGIAGANFGWPTTEGDFTQSSYPSFTRPFYTYSHSIGCAVTGGTFYNPPDNQFGASYFGKYFYADFCSGWIRTLDLSTKAVGDFATDISYPVDMRISPDGSLYYLSRGFSGGSGSDGRGSVWKIQNTVNQPPRISIQPKNQIIANGAPVTFSVSVTGTPPLNYQWQRNDVNISGTNAASYTIAHVSQQTDNGVRFRVTISNAFGTVTSVEATLTVPAGGAPTATITTPVAGTLYTAGDTINFQGTATDPDEGNLPASDYTWQVDFQHDTHAHPFFPPTSGITNGSFVIPTTGETSDNVWYRIYLTARDSTGLAQTVQREIFPRKATITLATIPTGLSFKLDGQPKTAPLSVLGVVGMVRSLEAFTQNVGGTNYEFYSWSDGGAAAHDISFPAINTTYTAAYRVATIVYLSNLNWVGTPTNGWGPVEKDMSNGDLAAGDGLPITLRGVTYAKGIGCHAISQITYDLGGRYSRFISDVGIDDETEGRGSVVFQVWADGVKVFDSGVVIGTDPVQTVDVSVAGKNQLQLIVDDLGSNGEDHSDWAGARLTLQAPSAVSRKTHGTATFDVNLPLGGNPGIECRTAGANNSYQMILTFAAPVTFSSAAITSGTGTVTSTTSSSDHKTITVNLTGVTNAQTITLTLSGVNDGINTVNDSIRMSVLLGDVNGSGSVNASDSVETKFKAGNALDSSNFRTDVNRSKSINSSDISLVKSKSGTALP